MGCVRVHIDKMVNTSHDGQKLDQNVKKVNTTSHKEVNVIHLMLNATQGQIVSIRHT